MVEMHPGLLYWTPDEVAECLDVGDDVYKKLWEILSDTKNPTPMGGDGSTGRPTVETPDGRLNSTPQWFHLLSDEEQVKVNAAYIAAYGD